MRGRVLGIVLVAATTVACSEPTASCDLYVVAGPAADGGDGFDLWIAGRDLERREALTTSGVAHDPDVSPDGTAVAFTDEMCTDPALTITELGAGHATEVIDAGVPLHHPRWTADGRETVAADAGALVCGGDVSDPHDDDTVVVIDVATGGRRALAPGTAPAPSPVRGVVAFVEGFDVVVIDLDTGEELHRHPRTRGEPRNDLVWSPDGRMVAWWERWHPPGETTLRDALVGLDVETGEVDVLDERVLADGEDVGALVAWTPSEMLWIRLIPEAAADVPDDRSHHVVRSPVATLPDADAPVVGPAPGRPIRRPRLIAVDPTCAQ